MSRFTAEYFVKQGDNVYVLNRGNKPQVEGVTPVICDRHELGDRLKGYSFDAVIDVCCYNKRDAEALVSGLGEYGCCVFISSSAVYPETLPLPFNEEMPCGRNSVWGDYGLGKLQAEEYILQNVKNPYILRPPYLYGKYENLYRSAYVFDCAEQGVPVYVPGDGSMPLQFFDVEDMCRFIGIILQDQPQERIFNVGNPDAVSVNEWVRLCFKAAGKTAEIKYAPKEHFARLYFPFYEYGYTLDVSRQMGLMTDVKPMEQGLKEEYEWYKRNKDKVLKRDYYNYARENFE